VTPADLGDGGGATNEVTLDEVEVIRLEAKTSKHPPTRHLDSNDPFRPSSSRSSPKLQSFS
jgi:hypothetical protein